jgi:predicted transcriptional regulator
MMTELTIQLPEDLIDRIRTKAAHEHISADVIVQSALAVYLDEIEDDPTDEDILKSIEQSLIDAKAGRVRSYDELTAYLKDEFGFDADRDFAS